MWEILEFVIGLLLHVVDIIQCWRFGITAIVGLIVLWRLEGTVEHHNLHITLTAFTVAVTVLVGVGWEIYAHH